MPARRLVVATVVVIAMGCTRTASAADVPVTFTVIESVVPVTDVKVFAADAVGTRAQPASVDIGNGDDRITIATAPGRDVVVAFALASGAYLLDGPLRWPDEPSARSLEYAPRRTVTGTVPAGHPGHGLFWIDETGVASTGPWPRCQSRGTAWECLGVPDGGRGVLVMSPAHPTIFVSVSPGAAGSVLALTQTTAWAVVVVVDGEPDRAAAIRLWRPPDDKATARHRFHDERAHGCAAGQLGVTTFLVSCAREEDVIVEIQQEGKANRRATMGSLSATLLAPIRLSLDAERPVMGRVETAQGRAAPLARLEISEVVNSPDRNGQVHTARRSIADLIADEDGRFELRGLGEGRYEVFALHERFGRGRLQFEPDSRPLIVRLATPSRVSGRVMRKGVPLAGATVAMPPDLSAYLKANDPFDVLALEAITGLDGRFEVALPPQGATEIRVSIDRQSVRRGLPPIAAGGRVDLGDIDLPAPLVVTVTYAGDDQCGLLAAGPFGRSGISVVEATTVGRGLKRLALPEPGTWILTAKCGTRELPVEPRMLDVPNNVTEWFAQVAVREPR